MSRHAAALVPLVLAGCAVTPPEEDPVQRRLAELDARLVRLERVLSNQSLVELSQRVEAMDAETRRQRGSLEVLENGAEAVRKQQRDLYADLDRRLAALEGGAPAAAGGGVSATVPGATRGPAADVLDAGATGERRVYDAAIESLKNARYDEAIAGFRRSLEAWPNGDLADNAQYWLGESYYVTRDYQSAANSFAAVGERWPRSRKSADALVKLGFAQYELQRDADAKQTLTQVRVRYPGTEAARLAEERLKRMIAEGR
jgi:tol-pal system protein YbgF